MLTSSLNSSEKILDMSHFFAPFHRFTPEAVTAVFPNTIRPLSTDLRAGVYLCCRDYSVRVRYRTCFECVAWFGSVGLLALGREHPGTNLPAVYFAVARPIRCGYCHTGLDEVCGRGWREAPLHITE